MQEARFSINVRYNFNGYDSQITMRDDENCGELIERFVTVITALEGKGATPARRWEDVKGGGGNGSNGGNGRNGGNGKTEPGTSQSKSDVLTMTKPICRHCGTADNMELVHFRKNEVDRSEWKCTACVKWHYDKSPG